MTSFLPQTYFDLFLIISYISHWLHIFHLAHPTNVSTSGRWCFSSGGANETKSEILLSAAMELLPLIMSKYVLFGTASTRRVRILWHRNLEWELVKMGKCCEKNLHMRTFFSLGDGTACFPYRTDNEFSSLAVSDVLELEVRVSGGKPSNMSNKITVDPFDFTNRFDSFSCFSISSFTSLISFALPSDGLSIEI